MMQMRKRVPGVSAVFLCWFLAGSTSVQAQSLDAHISILAQAVKDGDPDKALRSLEGATNRLSQLYDTAKSVKGPATELANTVAKALNAFSGEPMELGPFVDKIQKDTDRIDSIKPVAPDMGDPLRGVSDSELKSLDPGIRGRALDKVRAQGARLEGNYKHELNQLKRDRGDAEKLVVKADAADQRGFALEKKLDEMNSSAAGVFLNIGGDHLAYMLLDTMDSVRPALAGRLNAARQLVKRYDDVIAQADQTLARYELFNEWAGYYRWRDWAQENFKANEPKSVIEPSKDLSEARDLTNQADQRAKQMTGKEPQSRNTSLIEQLAAKTIAETNATRERADQLLRDAAKEDERAAALGTFTALVHLASAIHGASQSDQSSQTNRPSGDAKPPIVVNKTSFQFNLVVPPSPAPTGIVQKPPR